MIEIETVTPQRVFELAQTLPVDGLNWLLARLHRLADEAPLPENATLNEAVTYYVADRCSLGRAAELAGVTRWEIIDVLEEQGVPFHQDTEMTVDEMQYQIDQLELIGAL